VLDKCDFLSWNVFHICIIITCSVLFCDFGGSAFAVAMVWWGSREILFPPMTHPTKKMKNPVHVAKYSGSCRCADLDCGCLVGWLDKADLLDLTGDLLEWMDFRVLIPQGGHGCKGAVCSCQQKWTICSLSPCNPHRGSARVGALKSVGKWRQANSLPLSYKPFQYKCSQRASLYVGPFKHRAAWEFPNLHHHVWKIIQGVQALKQVKHDLDSDDGQTLMQHSHPKTAK